MSLSDWALAYVLFGLLFWLTVNLVNGTVPKPVQALIFAVAWPYFFYRGFIKGK